LISLLPSASVPSACRMPIASQGASAPHASVETPKHLVAGAKSALSAKVGWLGNGSTFGAQVKTQAAFGSTRVDGRAGSPPRGTPV
jgi:hypothetical protein